MLNGDREVLRPLAEQVALIAGDPKQEERRNLWRDHNSLVKTRPPVYVRAWASWQEIHPDSELQCKDPVLRGIERQLHMSIVQDSLDDDAIIEPWITVPAVHGTRLGAFRWGPEIRRSPKTMAGGSWMFDPPLKTEEDIHSLVKPQHIIDEKATAERVEKVQEAIGDLITIDVDRGPAYRSFTGDLSTDAANLRGLEQMMLDMVERPQWLHRLMRFMMEGIAATHQQAEACGDWRLTSGINQSMTYSRELPDPQPNSDPTPRRQLWTFCAAQEYAWVGPAMHEEFLLQYQLTLIEPFGLSAYGCCEDLTEKLDMLKQIPNLRRIAITPQADVRASAENLQRDYVLSWRPNPSLMICNGYDPDRVRRILTDGLTVARDCNIEIYLKDVQTIGHSLENLQAWTRLARELAEQFAP